MQYYKDNSGHFVTVAEGVIPNTYAFYRLNKNNPAARGPRIQMRPMKFYPNPGDGFAALKIYAGQKRWEYIGSKLPKQVTQNETKKDNQVLPLFAWQNEKPGPTKTFLVVSDVLYGQYKNELVRRSVLLVQTEMQGWHNAESAAVQKAMADIVRAGGMFSRSELSGLKKRLVNDTGRPVFSMDETGKKIKRWPLKNAYGGVYAHVKEQCCLKNKGNSKPK